MKPSLVNWYQPWSGNSGFVREQFELNDAQGIIPMLSWSPEADPNNLDQDRAEQPEYALRTIIAGDHDPYIRQTARDMKDWEKPIYLRFAHEMNGSWYAWGAGVNGNQPGEYVQAWRHIHDIFRQEGATNVRWVWSPVTKETSDPDEFSNFYPGDEYVDWVALDGYNWGTSKHGTAEADPEDTQKDPPPFYSDWKSFSEVFSDSYEEMVRLTDKPLMLAETASTEPLERDKPYPERNKAEWMRQGLLEDIPARFPRVEAVLWFNMIYDDRDWRVDSSSASLDAYKEVAASPLYQKQMSTLIEPSN